MDAEMAPVLRFDEVTSLARDGRRQIAVLDRVSFTVRERAFMGLFGMRRTGKSTLLRLAAGLQLPTEGSVYFKGRSLKGMSLLEREQLLRGPVAFVSAQEWRPKPGELVLDHVALALASRGWGVAQARLAARQALGRVGMLARAELAACELSLAERVRALLARALVRRPRLLLVDEPALIPSLSEREEVGALLRALARELGSAMIVASEDLAALHGATVLMSIACGELCSTEEALPEPEPEPGVVIELLSRRTPARERSPL
jgi:predicted ABC-type transport system involved in lysophospholipase L1 biosynthesis ATPase subunit